MDIVFLKNDGRCRWLENRVLKGIFPRMAEDSRMEDGKKKYLIVDWVSNDNGKVGLDLDWLASTGVPFVETYHDLPDNGDYAVVNTGYDSIVHEERLLRERGVEIIDMPCPYVRKVRGILEAADPRYQYVLLCEPNHIIIKNFKSLFPGDMILVQMNNCEQKILWEERGKPFRLVPYVTFLPEHILRVYDFINTTFPGRSNERFDTSCMWIKSPVSPIVEIERIPENLVRNMNSAALISSPGSINKSLVSLMETIKKRGLNVEIVSSLDEFKAFERRHINETILLVRSPIPNQAEEPIMNYLNRA